MTRTRGNDDEFAEARDGLRATGLFHAAAAAGAHFARLGGLTNRNYRVAVAGTEVVLRIPGEGTSAYIDRQVECHNAAVAARAGVGPELLHFDPADGVMVTRYVAGAATMTGERFRDPSAVARAGRALRAMHDWPEPFASRFDLFGKMDEYLALLKRLEAKVPDGYAAAQNEAEAVRRALADGALRLAPCHCDPLAENFLDTGRRMVVLDWEYAGMNDPMWDLGDVAVEAGFGPEQEEALLAAYFDGVVPVSARGRMILYKAMCDLLWTLWGVIQVANRNPVDDFWSYAVTRFERCRRLMASPEFARALGWVAGG
jgi:thiamine kinase-like enzyme